LIYPVLKIFFRLKVDRSNYDPPKGPFLAVSNHMSFMDFLLVMLSFYPRRLNAVTAQKFFLYKPLHKLLPIMGCIPKNLFDPDARSIKGIMTVLKRGDRILLFPEGRCSADGAYAGIHKSTGKLIKHLGVPVISCYIEGASVCMPFWRKGIRFGRTYVTLANLLSEEDTKSLTAEEVNSAIGARLSGSETPPLRKPLQTFGERRLAEGMQNTLYWCPKCRREFVQETKGCFIRCTMCGNEVRMGRYANLIASPGSVAPESVHAWYREQTRFEMNNLSENMEPICEKVTIRIPARKAGEGVMPGGAGELRLDPQGWHFEGELSGENVSLFFPIETVQALPFDPNDNFQIYAHGSFYMFTPEDSRKSIKYAVLGECAYRRFSPRIQMTPGYDDGFILDSGDEAWTGAESSAAP